MNALTSKMRFYGVNTLNLFPATLQIMKEWAEADNQSKNLPKTERQALNEVLTTQESMSE